VADLKQMAPSGTEHKIHLFAAESVPDPWYTGDFEETYSRVLSGCKAWLDQLATS
ncbi:MAG: low molecular weight phosphotyrosine protein phosphatase, partial [Streptococcus parasanguinis]|nr:low molecular weight phosphotyrosine protein phosphatase [Streptococcus parasanguinis]